ncbi:MAG TPA: CBS domain-containing protein [Polyangiaceae bacterium]|nr:CBS domain-containing protein [Polyangiaceae bacterium]
MIKISPQIREYMSTHVQTIGDEQTMLIAHRLMRQAQVEHLPVLHQAKLVGLLSDRDLNLIESLSDVDPKLVMVSDAMLGDPYVVTPDASLLEVASTMSQKKLRCAVITEHDKVVGIFTTAQACGALAALLG